MVNDHNNEDLDEKFSFDEGFIDYLKGSEKEKDYKKEEKPETELLEKMREILTKEFHYSNDQIISSSKIEIKNEIFKPDLVVYDSESEQIIIVVELKVINQSSYTAKKQLARQMVKLGIPYGVIYDGKIPEYFQQSNEFLIPIASIPEKSQVHRKFKTIPIGHELSEIIASNMTEILRKQGFIGIDVIVLSLEILLMKRFDELNYNNDNFKKISKEPRNVFELLINLWMKTEKVCKLPQRNHFETLSKENAVKLCDFVKNFSIKNSDIVNLFNALVDLNSSPYSLKINRTPQHLQEIMFSMLPETKTKKIHLVITGVGDSLSKLIYLISSQYDLTGNNLSKFFEENVSCSVENSTIYEILNLFSILSGIPLNLSLIGLSEIKSKNNLGKYDNIVIDGLILRAPFKTSDYAGAKFFHDQLLLQSLDFLKPHGNLVALVPKTYLFQKNTAREKILDIAKIKAIIELPILGSSFSTYNCGLILLEKREVGNISEQETTFMARYGSPKRSFFNPYNPKTMDEIFHRFQEFSKTGKMENQTDAGFFISSNLLKEDWTVSRKLPSLQEKLSKIKHSIKLKEIVEIISGRKYPGIDHKIQRKIPYILISDFEKLGQEKLVKEEKNPEELSKIKLEKFVTKEGDVLLSRSGTIGKVAIISKNNEGRLVSPGISILRIKDRDFLTPQLLKNQLSKKITQEQLNNFSISTFNFYLTNEMIGNVIINVPTREEQAEFIKNSEKIQAKIKQLRMEIDRHLNELKDLEGT